ncbi:MAG: response regulator [Alphaproteobacteria bacterium]
MAAHLEDLKVLLIDDLQESRVLMRNMMREMGITQIFECPDGQDGLHFLDTAPELVNLVLCDWNMPRMNGMALLKQLRSASVDVPFLMVTGRGDVASVVEAKGSGVTGYILKPFSQNQLEVKLRIVSHNIAKQIRKAEVASISRYW